jgi:hypothetical protein
MLFYQFGGAQGRDRTTDTAIFSRMLYQLSYLGPLEAERAYRKRLKTCPELNSTFSDLVLARSPCFA